MGDFGSLTDPPVNAPAQFDSKHVCNRARIVEITPQGELALSMRFGGKDSEGNCHSWDSYRALRIPNPFNRSTGGPEIQWAAG